MARMTLETDEVAAQLKPLLEQHLSNVKVGIDGARGFISGKKAFLSVEIHFTCRVSAPTTLITIDLECSSAARMGLDAMSSSLRNGRPYIESLDSKKCVINLAKVPAGGKMLSDFIVLKAAAIPAANGQFAAVDVSFIPQK